MQTTRRQFVKASSLTAVLGASGLAGCMGLGDSGETAGEQTYQYDPAELAPSPNVVFGSMDYGTLWDNRDQLPQSVRQDLETETESPVDPGDIDRMAGVAGGRIGQETQEVSMFGSLVLTGDLDKAAVEDQVESEGQATAAGDYEGYSLYEYQNLENANTVGGVGAQPYDASGTIAVGESAAIVGAGASQNADESVTGQQAVEQTIDAAAGDAALLDDAEGPAMDLKDHVDDSMLTVGMVVDPDLIQAYVDMLAGGGQSGSGGVSQFVDGLRAGGFGADVEGAETTMTGVVLYETETQADDSGIADIVSAFQAEAEQRDGIDDVSASQDGTAVTVTVAGDTKTLFEQGTSTGTMLNVAPQTA